MFELEPFVKAKLIDVEVLSQKNRKEGENPGAKLTFEVPLPNAALSTLDGHLLGTLYTKRGSRAANPQAHLDGMPTVSELPDLTVIGQQIGTFPWHQKLTGYTPALQYGIARDESNIESDSCEVEGLRVTVKEGGTIVAKFSVDAPDVSSLHWGKLPTLKGREVELALSPPDPNAQRDIDEGDKEKSGKRSQREGAEARG